MIARPLPFGDYTPALKGEASTDWLRRESSPILNIILAEAISRGILAPHSQLCHRSARDLGRITLHSGLGQICEV